MYNRPMLKAVIFDCFGVLYPNAAGIFFDAHKEQFGNDPSGWDAVNKEIDLGNISRTEFFQKTEEMTGIPAESARAEIDALLKPNDALVRFIDPLKKKYKIGLLSNAGKEEIQIIYRDKLDHLFDAIVVSYQLRRTKPDDILFEATVEKLGVSFDESLLIEDNARNIKAAQALGMQTLLYADYGSSPEELIHLIH